MGGSDGRAFCYVCVGNFGIVGRSLRQFWHFGAIIGGHSLREFEKHFLFNLPVFTNSVLLRLAPFLAVCGQHGGLRWEGFLLRLCGQFWHCYDAVIMLAFPGQISFPGQIWAGS